MAIAHARARPTRPLEVNSVVNTRGGTGTVGGSGREGAGEWIDPSSAAHDLIHGSFSTRRGREGGPSAPSCRGPPRLPFPSWGSLPLLPDPSPRALPCTAEAVRRPLGRSSPTVEGGSPEGRSLDLGWTKARLQRFFPSESEGADPLGHATSAARPRAKRNNKPPNDMPTTLQSLRTTPNARVGMSARRLSRGTAARATRRVVCSSVRARRGRARRGRRRRKDGQTTIRNHRPKARNES
eukprot:scaffold281_cov318-Pavlova_lutheri.AAC.33